MKIGAGIFHYRFWPEVRPTIDGILAQTRPPDVLLLFDHASGDGSADKIRAVYPDLEVVEASVNRGAAVGAYTAVELLLERGCEAAMSVPDDLELAPNAIEALAGRLEEAPTVGAAGPLIAHPHDRGRIFYAGGYVRRHNWSLDFRTTPAEVSEWEGEPPQPVDFLQMGGALLRAEAVRQVGGSARKYYHWGDDVDVTLRIGAHGWGVECVPAAVGWQDFSTPSPYIATRNHLLLIGRNAPKRFVARELTRQLYWLGRDAIKPQSGTREDLWPRLRGVVDFCRGRWGPPPDSLSR